MRNKIRLALFALCTAVVSGTAELYADERIPAAAARQTAEASQYDIVYQENHTHTIAPAGETFSLDLLSVAQKMYTAIGLPDDPANVGVTVYSPTLREGSYLARKQDLLRGCESLLGLRRGILSEVETPAEPRTATEIAATSVDYDLTIRDLQSAWTDTVQQAMALCSALGAVYGLDGLPQTAAPAIDWGDGVLYDRARIWAEQRELVDAGLLRPELALAWYFDLPHETEAELAEIRRRFMGDAGRAQ